LFKKYKNALVLSRSASVVAATVVAGAVLPQLVLFADAAAAARNAG